MMLAMAQVDSDLCPDNRHDVRRRPDGSSRCLRCGREWGAPDDESDITARPAAIRGILPTMDQQERGMGRLFEDLVTIDESEDHIEVGKQDEWEEE